MSVPAAYIGVILIWTTTPLAIKWSNEGSHFLVGVSLRMLIGAVVCLLLVRVSRSALPWHRRAVQAYLLTGVSVYLSMTCVYWAAQYIPSGWISVIFGLNPLLTGLIAGLWLGEKNGSPSRIGGMLLGVTGLVTIFGDGSDFGPQVAQGVAAVLVATTIHSVSAVLLKKLGDGIPTLSLTGVGVAISVLLFALTWLVVAPPVPSALPPRAIWSIIYLGLAGSVLGFTLYYYVLKHVEATKTALITLITPVSALLLGYTLNGEPLTWQIALGTATILVGLLLFQYGDGVTRLRRRAPQGS